MRQQQQQQQLAAATATGGSWLGVGAPPTAAQPFQRPFWVSEGSPQLSPALVPTAAPPIPAGGGGGGASSTLGGGLNASPPLAPIGSNRHRRSHSDASSSSSSSAWPGLGGGLDGGGAQRRAPPGLSPSTQPVRSFLPLEAAASASVEQLQQQQLSLLPPSAVRDPDLDNMNGFATAAAVVAGVLDMAGEMGYSATTALDDAGAASSSLLPSSFFGLEQHGSSHPLRTPAVTAAGSTSQQYGEQPGLAFGAAPFIPAAATAGSGGGSGAVLDNALDLGRYAHQGGNNGNRAPARTVGGGGGAGGGGDGGRGSRLGFYMSSSPWHGGTGTGGSGGSSVAQGGDIPATGVRTQFDSPGERALYFDDGRGTGGIGGIGGGRSGLPSPSADSSSSGAVSASADDVFGFVKDGDKK